jgi:type II secretory pathway component PulJ
MDEKLISFLSAILIAGIVVLLRLRRKLREVDDEAAALKKRIVVLEQHNVQLKQAQRRTEAEVRNLRFLQERPPRVNSRVAPPSFSPIDRREQRANLLLIKKRQKEFAKVRNRLDVLYAEGRHFPQKRHIVEFDSIVERLERATGCNLSTWLGIPPQKEQPVAGSPGQFTKVSIGQLQARNSHLFRTGIMSLRAFCSYQIAHSQLRQGFAPPPPKAAGLIH